MTRQPAIQLPRPRNAALRALGVAALMALSTASAGMAQSGPFSAVKVVNESVVTRFEVDQRILFMQILRQPGDLEAMALNGLIDDRLRSAAAKDAGISVPADAVQAGMQEFAGRANLSPEEFIKIVGEMGLSSESFRDFVQSGVAWREVVRAKFGPSIKISDAQIDAYLTHFTPTTAIKARVSEIVIPAKGAEISNAMALARRLKSELAAGADFATLARGTSSGVTAARGGARDWQRLSQLDPEVAAVLRSLAPGQVSAPLTVGDTVVLYQMQELGQDTLAGAPTVLVDYAQFLLPNDANFAKEAARLRANSDTCDDLYPLARKLPAERLIRESQPQASLPADLRGALSLLDAGETNTQLTRGPWRVFLMLCSRGPAAEDMPSRDEVRLLLTNQRLGAQAEIFLEELRSEAIIGDP